MSRHPDRLVVLDGDVDTAVVAEYEASRRDALRKGIGVGGAVLAAATIPGLLRVRNAFAQTPSGDVAIITSAVHLEQVAVLAYDTAVKSGVLKGDVLRTAMTFRDQEQAHATALAAALKGLGGTPQPAPTSVRDVDAVVPGLGKAKSVHAIATFAIELEMMAVAAYYEAHQKLQTAALLQTGSTIMANEGQHLALLRQVVKQNPVPDAFETGSRS